jgi:hypothetical protein
MPPGPPRLCASPARANPSPPTAARPCTPAPPARAPPMPRRRPHPTSLHDRTRSANVRTRARSRCRPKGTNELPRHARTRATRAAPVASSNAAPKTHVRTQAFPARPAPRTDGLRPRHRESQVSDRAPPCTSERAPRTSEPKPPEPPPPTARPNAAPRHERATPARPNPTEPRRPPRHAPRRHPPSRHRPAPPPSPQPVRPPSLRSGSRPAAAPGPPSGSLPEDRYHPVNAALDSAATPWQDARLLILSTRARHAARIAPPPHSPVRATPSHPRPPALSARTI